MATKTENNGFKFFKSESETRNRGDELAERIMVCPYCGFRGLTFRKLQTRHVCPPGKREHDDCGDTHHLLGIQCLAKKCLYMCKSGVDCFSRHVRAYHGNNKGKPYVAVGLDCLSEELEDEHTGHCMFLSKVHAVKRQEEEDLKEKERDLKNQFKLAKLLYKDMKDIHAKRVKVAKIEMNLKVKMMKKAIRNGPVNKNSIFGQDRSKRKAISNEPVNKNSIFGQDRSKRAKFEQIKLLP